MMNSRRSQLVVSKRRTAGWNGLRSYTTHGEPLKHVFDLLIKSEAYHKARYSYID